jgi:hypothetical protein
MKDERINFSKLPRKTPKIGILLENLLFKL